MALQARGWSVLLAEGTLQEQLDAKPDSTVVQWVMANNVVRTVSLRQLSAAYVQAVERLVYDWPEVYTELNK